MRATPGAFVDKAGNTWAGIGDSTTWTFRTVADATSPQVVQASSVPAADATGVSLDTQAITVMFTEPVVMATDAAEGAGVTITEAGTGRSAVLPLADATFVDDSVELQLPQDFLREKARCVRFTASSQFAVLLDKPRFGCLQVHRRGSYVGCDRRRRQPVGCEQRLFVRH